MSYPGITFVLMVSVAIGSAIYYYLHGDWRQQNEPHGYRTDDCHDFQSVHSSRSGSPHSSKKRKKGSRGVDCCICLQTMKNSTKTLSCGHIYHRHCIDTWLNVDKTCPVCRKAEPICQLQ